jgi:uncharacterized protein YsxB (DUF464 family)
MGHEARQAARDVSIVCAALSTDLLAKLYHLV